MAGADMVLLNGKVFTADKARPMAQALAMADGKVLAVGSDAEISALADAGTQRIGSLTVGKQADFILLDRDVFTVDAKALAETRVLKTWFGGRAVYEASL